MTRGIFEELTAEVRFRFASMEEDAECFRIAKGEKSRIVLPQQAGGGIITGGHYRDLCGGGLVHGAHSPFLQGGESEEVAGSDESEGLLCFEGPKPLVTRVFCLLALDLSSKLFLQDGSGVKDTDS